MITVELVHRYAEHTKDVGGEVGAFAPVLSKNAVSKDTYILIVQSCMQSMDGIFCAISDLYVKHVQTFPKNVTKLKNGIGKYRVLFDTYKLPQDRIPRVCAGLHMFVAGIYNILENILLVVESPTRGDQNVINCVTMFLEQYANALKFFVGPEIEEYV